MSERKSNQRGNRQNINDGYSQGPYSQGDYSQGPYSQGGYQQGPYGQNGYQQGGYSQAGQGSYQQNGSGRGQQQGGYSQGGYQQGNPGGYQQGSYNRNYQQPPYGGGKPPKKKGKAKRRVLFVVELLVLLILAGGLFVFAQLNRIQRISFQQGEIQMNEEIPVEEQEVMETYTNIALYGVDSRSGDLEHDAHSDTIIIASINNKTKEIKLVSVYRDTYLDNTNGEYRKATECYFYGGASRSINMLNKNLDLDIEDFVTVDFNVVAEAVNAVDGVEIDVQENEIQWINGYQDEGSQVTGLEKVEVTEPGLQTLNGLQALSYCRIRYGGGDDYKRTERQRTVLEAILNKIQQDPTKAVGLVNSLFDDIYTSLTLTEMLSLAKDVTSYSLVDTTGFPFDSTPQTNNAGDCVVPVNLAQNVLELHKWMFGSDGYTPSATVQEISNEIINATGVQ